MLRDDIIEYSLDAHHSEEEGKKKRKAIWKVTAILTLITIVEVAVGIYFPKKGLSDITWAIIKYSYIILTVIKSAYIVMIFMHLGDERRNFKMMVLVPYLIFILYLIFQLLNEGSSVGMLWNEFNV
ncbi:MAG: cytochrome C oxidase subunit IV family protein [Putridiphycobacter sp.]